MAVLSDLPPELLIDIFRMVVRHDTCMITTKTHNSEAFETDEQFALRTKQEQDRRRREEGGHEEQLVSQQEVAKKTVFSFVSEQYSAFTVGSGLSGPYRMALREHIIGEATEIRCKVYNFDFANLKFFLKRLKEEEKLDAFMDREGMTRRAREILVGHFITKKLPDTFKKFHSFEKALNSPLKQLAPAKKFCLTHWVFEYEDISPLKKLYQTVGDMDHADLEKLGHQFKSLYCAIRECMSWQHTNDVYEQLPEMQYWADLEYQTENGLFQGYVEDEEGEDAVAGAEQDGEVGGIARGYLPDQEFARRLYGG